MKITHIKKFLTVSGFILATCFMQNTAMAQQKNDPKFNNMMTDSFRAQGIAGLDRIQPDETQKFCSDPVFAGSKQGEKMRDKIQKINMDSVMQPSNGKYIGDWKKVKLLPRAVVEPHGLIKQMLQLEAGAITVIRLIKKKFLMEILGHH